VGHPAPLFQNLAESQVAWLHVWAVIG
jgi:hypothetical protein